MEKGYVCYPIQETRTVPVTYAESKDIFTNKNRQYENQDMPLVAEFSYKELKDHDNYDPYFKHVQKDFEKVRTPSKKNDYFENVKMRDQLDQYIESTRMSQELQTRKKEYKDFIKDYEEKDLWSRRKKECENKYPGIFKTSAKSVLARYKQVNDMFAYDPRGIYE